MTIARLELPPKLIPVFAPPRGSLRYRVAKGGRSSGKSFNFAKMAAVWGVIEPLRILCTRDLQVSIRESFHAELKNAIASEPWLQAAYDVGTEYLRSKINGTEFLFKGLRHNVGTVKSTAQIDLCIVEEAEDVSMEAWIALEPTIRADKSEIWVLYNPKLEGSPVDKMFVQQPPERAVIVDMNYMDNPWLPDVMEELRARQQRTMDPEMYAHIWLGKYLKASKATVFHGKWRVDSFTPDADWDGPYFGLDFGFSQDPTAAVKLWVHNSRLYIEYEAGGIEIENDDMARLLIKELPGIEKHVVVADNARPELISHLKKPDPNHLRPNLPKIEGCSKGKGSVEDGISFMKSFEEIIVHPRCMQVQEEFRMYSFKIDRLSGEILPVVVDKWNHYMDATRYALEKVRKKNQFFAG